MKWVKEGALKYLLGRSTYKQCEVKKCLLTVTFVLPTQSYTLFTCLIFQHYKTKEGPRHGVFYRWHQVPLYKGMVF